MTRESPQILDHDAVRGYGPGATPVTVEEHPIRAIAGINDSRGEEQRKNYAHFSTQYCSITIAHNAFA